MEKTMTLKVKWVEPPFSSGRYDVEVWVTRGSLQDVALANEVAAAVKQRLSSKTKR